MSTLLFAAAWAAVIAAYVAMGFVTACLYKRYEFIKMDKDDDIARIAMIWPIALVILAFMFCEWTFCSLVKRASDWRLSYKTQLPSWPKDAPIRAVYMKPNPAGFWEFYDNFCNFIQLAHGVPRFTDDYTQVKVTRPTSKA